jgi:hypothetical protein
VTQIRNRASKPTYSAVRTGDSGLATTGALGGTRVKVSVTVEIARNKAVAE